MELAISRLRLPVLESFRLSRNPLAIKSSLFGSAPSVGPRMMHFFERMARWRKNPAEQRQKPDENLQTLGSHHFPLADLIFEYSHQIPPLPHPLKVNYSKLKHTDESNGRCQILHLNTMNRKGKK